MGKMCQCGGNGDRSKINDIAKCKVESTVRVGIRGKKWNDRSDKRVSMSVTAEEIKKNRPIKGAKVVNVQRTKSTRDRVEKDSETVLIESEEEMWTMTVESVGRGYHQSLSVDVK